MASTARTWFYHPPENNPYLLQERVNGTLWINRLWDVSFVCEQAEPPYRMSAAWNGQHVRIEWEPGRWFRLRAPGNAPALVSAFSNVLQIPASITFTDADGQIITEWHRDGGDARWREIQGNPGYQSPVRLNR